MIVAARIAGLLAIVGLGLAIGLHYDVGIARTAAKFWLPISTLLAFTVAFWGAPSAVQALSRYESTPPRISGGRIFMGIAGAALATAASSFLMALGIFVR